MDDEQPSSSDSLLDLGAEDRGMMDQLNKRNTEIESLSAKGRKELALEQVRRAVRQEGDSGISTTEIAEITGLAKKTVRNHLDRLRNLREVYREKKGNMYLYYPNGRPLWSVGSKFIECSDGETGIEIQVAKGKNDEHYFHISEKRYSLLEGETNEGAIIFPIENFSEICQGMKELSEEVE